MQLERLVNLCPKSFDLLIPSTYHISAACVTAKLSRWRINSNLPYPPSIVILEKKRYRHFMKLILCPDCHQAISLRNTLTKCECEKSWGKYINDIDAIYGGNAIPLGFDNSSLVSSIKRQPAKGLGETFTAFVIPKQCPTFKRENSIIQHQQDIDPVT